MSEEATSTSNHSSAFSTQFSTCSSMKSSVDSTDSQDMFPTASSRFILRPSPLAVQTEKLKIIGSTTSESQSLIFTSHKHEDKENKCISDNTEQLGESDNSNVAKKQVLSSDTLRPSDDSAFKSLFKSECSKSSAPLELIATSGPTNFVFGQNLHERVVTYEDSESDSSSSISNQLNFQAFRKGSSDDVRQECTGKPVKSLTQSAEEYQARQVKRKYDEVTVVTGEEGESNVLQINCKLFAFEQNSSWVERGRGMLRLNDREVDGTLQSRLVMRTQGSLRLVLNTKVWAGMSLEQASHKSIRFSAVETDGVKVYLVMANPKDTEQLSSALECRVATLKSLDDDDGSVSNLATRPSIESYNDDDTSDCESEVKRPRHMEDTQSREADSTTGVAPPTAHSTS